MKFTDRIKDVNKNVQALYNTMDRGDKEVREYADEQAEKVQ